MTPLDTSQLTDRAREGDRDAYRQLVEAYRGEFRAYLTGAMGETLTRSASVDDVLQEVFFRAYVSLDRFEWRDERSFPAWLKSIARCLIVDMARKEKRRSAQTLDERELPKDATSPSRLMRREERLFRLRDAVSTLLPDHRLVIELSVLEGLPLRVVAERMSRSEAAAKQLLFRAMQNLREIFGDTESLHLPEEFLRPILEDRGDSPLPSGG